MGAVSTVGTDGVGFAYVEPSRLVDAIAGHAPGGTSSGAQALRGLLAGSGVHPVPSGPDRRG